MWHCGYMHTQPGSYLSEAEIERFSRSIRKEPNGCVRWLGGKTSFGYGKIYVKVDGRRGHGRLAHRVAFRIANGRWPVAGKLLLHSCDNAWCVNAAHLREGTHADNSADMVEKGRSSRGESHYMARLTADDVLSIRAQRAEGVQLKELAQLFGVSKQNIYMIVHRRSWKHV